MPPHRVRAASSSFSSIPSLLTPSKGLEYDAAPSRSMTSSCTNYTDLLRCRIVDVAGPPGTAVAAHALPVGVRRQVRPCIRRRGCRRVAAAPLAISLRNFATLTLGDLSEKISLQLCMGGGARGMRLHTRGNARRRHRADGGFTVVWWHFGSRSFVGECFLHGRAGSQWRRIVPKQLRHLPCVIRVHGIFFRAALAAPIGLGFLSIHRLRHALRQSGWLT